MKLHEIEEHLTHELSTLYDARESGNIADWILESLTGRNRMMRNMDKSISLSEEQKTQLESYLVELMEYRPVQYVLGESYFYGMKLFVDENVLIPRPETEELADWIVKYITAKELKQPAVLDIGTGSGCLALAVKKAIPQSKVYAADISEGALAVAGRNAKDTGLPIELMQLDILAPTSTEVLPQLDLIISNPPYITLPEQQTIMPHVLQYEPHQALFVTNEDPLQFYKAIETFAQTHLKPGGSIFLELHRDFATDTEKYFKDKSWETELKQDMQEQDRMLHVVKK
jgi:release factor glutamine methyltransferase